MPQPMKRESTHAPGEVPSPEIIFDTFNAYQKTASLKAAIELDIFTAIGEGNRTAKALATRCKASERGVRILCDYLVVNGFLTKESSEYGLSPVSAAFLGWNRMPQVLPCPLYSLVGGSGFTIGENLWQATVAATVRAISPRNMWILGDSMP